MSAPDVSVVVVSYNAADWLPRALASVAAVRALAVETVVVDNASEQAVRSYLARLPEGIRLVQLAANVGFGRAVNVGVARSTGRYVMLLNPDAELRPGALEALVDFLRQDPRRGIVGGRTVRPGDGEDVVDPSSCWGRPTLWSWFCSATGLTALARRSPLLDPESLGHWQRDTVREVDIVTGCLLLTERSTWEALGGFDERFFMYGEDADLCLRAHDAGWRPAITPAAVAVHAVGASSASRLGKQRLLLQGKATLARTRWGPARARLGIGLLAAGVGLRALAERCGLAAGDRYRELWRTRAQWLAGYPPATEPPTVLFESVTA